MVELPKSIFIYDDNHNLVKNPEISNETYEAEIAKMKAANIEALWNAAHMYEFREISGAGIGLLILGTIKEKPKALAVQAWVQSIWALYYQRKPLVTHIFNEDLLDFSNIGNCPYSVPELLEELGM